MYVLQRRAVGGRAAAGAVQAKREPMQILSLCCGHLPLQSERVPVFWVSSVGYG